MGARRSIKRKVLACVLVLYVLTWTFGTPMISNHYANETLNSYVRISRTDVDYHQSFQPRFRFLASFPVIPFVLLSRHEHAFGNVGGASGWFLTVWYGTGIYEVQVSGWRS